MLFDTATVDTATLQQHPPVISPHLPLSALTLSTPNPHPNPNQAAQKRLKVQAAHAARVGKYASPMGKMIMESQVPLTLTLTLALTLTLTLTLTLAGRRPLGPRS